MLLRKLFRDIRRQGWLAVVLMAVTAIGVALFVASAASYRNLDLSYREIQDELGLAHLQVELRNGSASHLARARGVVGVERAELRRVADVPLVVDRAAGAVAGATAGAAPRATAGAAAGATAGAAPGATAGAVAGAKAGAAPGAKARAAPRATAGAAGAVAGDGQAGGPGSLRVTGRLIGLPRPGHGLNTPVVVSGRLPERGEVLVEQHFARYHRLEAGSTVRIDLPGERRRTLTVSGVSVSPEYLWVSRSEQDPMPTPLDFGVFWIGRQDLAGVARRFEARAVWMPVGVSLAAGGLAGGADPASGNQLLVTLASGVDAAHVRRDLEAALGPEALRVTPRDQLPGIRMLQLDLDSFREIAWFFPMLFLGVAGFMLLSSIGRVVESQRPVIGTFLALGMPRGRLVLHYLAQAVVPAAAASVLGAVLGTLASSELTRGYAAELGIPAVRTRFHPDLLFGGVVLGTAAAALAAWLPASRAAGMMPVEAMRPQAPPAIGASAMLRQVGGAGRVSTLAMAVRNVARRPVRSVLSALGVAASLLLLLISGVVFDGTVFGLSFQLERAQRYDFRVDFYLPWDEAALEERVRDITGLKEIETALAFPVILAVPGKEFHTVLEGARAGATLLQTLEFGGAAVVPAEGRIVLAREVARKLGVAVGGNVDVLRLPDRKRVALTVGGLSDSALGGGATVRLEDARASFGLPGRVNSLRVTCDPARRWDVRRALDRLPRVAAVQDRIALRDLVGEKMAFGFAFIGAMVAFSAVLAAAILFNTVTLSILERTRELATLRALGMSLRRCWWLLTAEHALIAAGGLAIGLPAGIAAAQGVLAMYRSDLFSLPFVVTGRTVGLAVLGVILVVALAMWPGFRQLARVDLAGAIRERTG